MLEEVEAIDSDEAEGNVKAAMDAMDDFDSWIAETEDVVGGSVATPKKNSSLAMPPLEQPVQSTSVELSVARSLLRKQMVKDGHKEDCAEQAAAAAAAADDSEVDEAAAEQVEVEVEVEVDADGSDSRFDDFGADNIEEKETMSKEVLGATEDAAILELDDEGDDALSRGSGGDRVGEQAALEDRADATAATAEAEVGAETEAPLLNSAFKELAAAVDDYVDEDVWDVDELTHQSELLGELEARTRDGLKEASTSKKSPEAVPKARLTMPEEPPPSPHTDMDQHNQQAADAEVMEINTDDEDPIPPNEEDDGEPSQDEPDDILGAVSSLLDEVQDRVKKHKTLEEVRVTSSGPKKRGVADSEDEPPATKQKMTSPADPPDEMEGDDLSLAAEDQDDGEEVDMSSCDMQLLVVNFIDVGQAYAKTVLEEGDAKFDWEGVRTCLQHLRYERGLRMVGVAPQGFRGADSWSNSECTLPEDVRDLCDSMEEPSCKAWQCSSRTLALAKSKCCRFVDSKAKPQRALVALRLPYAFDADAGTFTALDATSGDQQPEQQVWDDST